MRLSQALATLSLGLAALGLTTCREERPRQSGLEELAAALEGRRPVEPRLTGFDVHVACAVSETPGRLIPETICPSRPLAGTALYKKVREIIVRLQRQAQRGPSEEPEGVALGGLVLGEEGASARLAVEALEDAAARNPRDARLLSNLSAAYLLRSQQADDPRDLVRALDAAARAREADPSLRAALFNFALAAERLYLRRTAQAAWTEYRDRETDPAWKAEANAHLAALARPSAPERWKQALPELEVAALRGDEAAVRSIVEIDPQTAREHALEERLGDWGDRLLAGDPAGAARSLRIASALGKALRSIHGDSTIAAAVEAIERVRTPSLPDLARSHRAFRDALRHFKALETKEAALRFTEARDGFRRGSSPIGLWAEAGLGRVAGYDSRFEEAEAVFQSVLDEAERQSFPSLAGWCHWGLAWLKFRQGSTFEALQPLQAAEAAYGKLGEPESTATIWSYLGELLTVLGQDGTAWRYRYQALSKLSERPESWRWHILLRDGAAAAVENRWFEAGLLFQQEGVLAAETIGEPVRLAEAFSARSQILLALGRVKEVHQDLRQAFRYARQADIGSPGKKLAADLSFAWGEALRQIEPEAALNPLTEAIEAYREIKAVPSFAYALLSRARLHLALGRDGEAEADLRAAIELLEDPGSEMSDPDFQVSYSDSLQSFYDEWIHFQWVRRKNPEAALEAVERARTFARGGRWTPARVTSGGGEPWAERGRIPEGVFAIEYALLKDRLLIWCLSADGLSAFEREVGQEEVEGRVEAFLRAIRRNAGPEEIAELSSALYELLIPEPVEPLVRGEELYIVPDKVLHKVAFAALLNPTTEHFLVEDHPVIVTPSLLHLLQKQERPTWARKRVEPASVFFVGNPAFDRALSFDLSDLPGAEAELEVVRRASPQASVLTGEEATKERVLAELDRHETFIFAGHSVVNVNRPFRSFLALASSAGDPTSGLLFATDLSGRRFQHLRTVVLSSCASIGPRASRASGLTGLARPFLDAGVETVVGSLWKVDDQAAVPFLSPFYIALARGQPAPLALRAAQLEAIGNRERALRSIATWASFEIVQAAVNELDSEP